jgi:hypothetical protein
MSAAAISQSWIDTLMNTEVFERFEKTRGGLLIPVLLFVVGAVATVMAIRSVHGVARQQLERSDPAGPVEGDPGRSAAAPRGDVANDRAVPERGQWNL